MMNKNNQEKGKNQEVPIRTFYPNPDNYDTRKDTRIARTVRVEFPPDRGPFERRMFWEHLKRLGIEEMLETCGTTAKKNEFILTFETMGATKIFKDFGDFETEKGIPCRVNIKKPEKRNFNGKISVPIKVHWVPYHIDMQVALSELEKEPGIKITGARYDTIKNDPEMSHIRTGLRTVWVEVDNTEVIPHKIQWKNKGEKGTALLIIFGRAVPCFRCWNNGHTRQDCVEVKCGKCHKFGHNTNSC